MTSEAQVTQAALKFVEEDLLSSDVRAAVVDRHNVKVVTDLAIYRVRIVDDRVGMLVKADKRRPDDRIYDAGELKHQLYLSRDRRSSEERVRKLGLGAMRWPDLNGEGQSSNGASDVTSWYALIVLEAFTWLREQFRLYPVEILPAAPDDEASLIWLVPPVEGDRDQRRRRIGLRPTADAIRRELLP